MHDARHPSRKQSDKLLFEATGWVRLFLLSIEDFGSGPCRGPYFLVLTRK